MPGMPLERFKVIDLTRVRAGPTCVRQLVDWGAKAIKVEATDDDGLGGPRHNADFQNLHRNKRSLTLNLKEPDGKKILMKLVEQADVVVENFRPDVKHRLGIDYESLRKVNKRIVYASISGFGQDGPYRERPGVDQIAQGMGGLMWITGEPGRGPMRVGTAIADLTAGGFAAQGILIALLEREVSGEGQWVQTSLLQAQIAMLDFQGARYLMHGEVPDQVGNDHPTTVPTSAYPTADGYINIAAAGSGLYKRLCEGLGAPHLLEDPRFKEPKTRIKNRALLNETISEITRKKTNDQWIEILNKAGVPCGPIYKMDQVFADPQVKYLGIAQSVKHPKLGDINLIGQPMTLSRTPSSLRTAPPEKGEHNDEVLRELGYDDHAINDFKQRKIV
jgi:formyl-CoA transferase